jgi:Domain of unknown function (DUF4386)
MAGGGHRRGAQDRFLAGEAQAQIADVLATGRSGTAVGAVGEELSMDAQRRTALTAGVVFIAATVASLLGSAVEQPVLNGPEYLTRVAGHARRVAAGGLLEFLAAGTSVGIAIALYPVLRQWRAGLALGAVVFRTIEAAMYTVGAVSLLALVPVGHQVSQAASADRAALQAPGDALLGVRQAAILAGVFAFCVGALMYSYVFYQSRLMPRWLAGWGMVAELLLLVACVSALFSRRAVMTYTLLILPIALQEMVLAVWLIARGFSSSALQSRAASAGSAG